MPHSLGISAQEYRFSLYGKPWSNFNSPAVSAEKSIISLYTGYAARLCSTVGFSVISVSSFLYFSSVSVSKLRKSQISVKWRCTEYLSTFCSLHSGKKPSKSLPVQALSISPSVISAIIYEVWHTVDRLRQ